MEEKGAENTARARWKIESQSEKKEASRDVLVDISARFHVEYFQPKGSVSDDKNKTL